MFQLRRVAFALQLHGPALIRLRQPIAAIRQQGRRAAKESLKAQELAECGFPTPDNVDAIIQQVRDLRAAAPAEEPAPESTP